MNFPRRLIVLPVLAIASIGLVACGSDAKQPAGTNAPTETSMTGDTMTGDTMTGDTMAPHDTEVMTSDTHAMMTDSTAMMTHDTEVMTSDTHAMMTETTGG